MSTARAGQPGATRVCPHCKATVLESAAVCPGCRHHLRFSTTGKQFAAIEGYCALSVDGTIAHKLTGEPCEYSIVLDITNERGEQLVRQVVGVGALQPGELRRLNLSVDMLPLASQMSKAPATAPPSPDAATTAAGVRPASPTAAAAAAAAPRVTPPPVAPRGFAPGTPQQPPSQQSPRGSLQPPPAPGAAPAAPRGSAPAIAAPKTLAPGPGSTLSQRLRIFRKP